MTLASGPVVASTATGGSGLPAEPPEQTPPPEPATTTLPWPRGSVWAAQVGAIRTDDFVLLVAGMPFDVRGAAPAAVGGTLMVRVVEDAASPVFEVLAPELPHAQNAALRALLAHLLRRALAAGHASRADAPIEGASPSPRDIASALLDAAHQRLTQPTDDLVRYLDSGRLRVDLVLPARDTPSHWHVDLHDTHGEPESQEAPITATVLVDLPATGPVEVRLALTATGLQVKFFVATEEVRDSLLARSAELTGALAAVGFFGIDVAADADPGRLARDRASDDVPREAPRAGGLLDIRV